MTSNEDLDFFRACQSAADMIKSRRSRADRVAAASDLVAILLSDRPIGPGDRRHLAELLNGDIDSPPGNRLTASERKELRERAWMVQEYQNSKAAEGVTVGKAKAAQALADDGRLPVDDVEKLINYINQSREKRGDNKGTRSDGKTMPRAQFEKLTPAEQMAKMKAGYTLTEI
ncbi:hypothetical protein NKI12_19425 [Mesorhizobium australicum]|uniref:Uncharacterized protein n=1 Tax=Mesorhizobium australicum TaxID=536018 RepID=A0ACC6SZJ4_9HYPH